ncbi:MAG: eS25 family ribosomal protein [Candidatus Jordarchaeaceae archaeon]
MSKKKWTKEPKAVEKEVRKVVLDEELKSAMEEEIPKMKIVTPSTISAKYKIRVSTAKEIIRELENKGKLRLVEENRRLKVYATVGKGGEAG